MSFPHSVNNVFPRPRWNSWGNRMGINEDVWTSTFCLTFHKNRMSCFKVKKGGRSRRNIIKLKDSAKATVDWFQRNMDRHLRRAPLQYYSSVKSCKRSDIVRLCSGCFWMRSTWRKRNSAQCYSLEVHLACCPTQTSANYFFSTIFVEEGAYNVNRKDLVRFPLEESAGIIMSTAAIPHRITDTMSSFRGSSSFSVKELMTSFNS